MRCPWPPFPFGSRVVGFWLLLGLLARPFVTAGQSPSREVSRPAVREVLRKVDPGRIAATVHKLASFPSRHSASEGCDEAARWLAEQFRGLGYVDVTAHEFDLRGRTCRNVVCTKRGTATPESILILGAHYDSRSRDLTDPDAPAPGADDNASGIAGLLELARVLNDLPTKPTIRFIAFAGEEQGLVGSRAYARLARAEGWPISLMINLDMIGHPLLKEREKPVVVVEHDHGHRRPENDAASKAVADRMVRDAADVVPGLAVRRGPLYGTDYMPFEAEGFVCVGVFDGADKAAFYHTDDDTPDVVDFEYAADVVRLVLATVLATSD